MRSATHLTRDRPGKEEDRELPDEIGLLQRGGRQQVVQHVRSIDGDEDLRPLNACQVRNDRQETPSLLDTPRTFRTQTQGDRGLEAVMRVSDLRTKGGPVPLDLRALWRCRLLLNPQAMTANGDHHKSEAWARIRGDSAVPC